MVTPDVWKDGARNVIGGLDGGRKLGMNMLLKNRKKPGFSPAGLNSKFGACLGCKKKSITPKTKFCNSCAYKKGRCQRCGIKILKTKMYR